jgi:hypothetical protein
MFPPKNPQRHSKTGAACCAPEPMLSAYLP